MKRSELYARVWAEPMIRVAADLGLSGPGLAKLCARSGIPTPARGHWAKLQAGKRSPQPPLPQPELDPNIALPTPVQRERKERKRTFDEGVRSAIDARGEVSGAPPSGLEEEGDAKGSGARAVVVTMAATLERPHPLVRATAVVVGRLPALLKRLERATPAQRASPSMPYPPLFRFGRYELDVTGGLALIASLETMDWILRFVDALLNGLRQQGVTIERTALADERVATLKLQKVGEVLVFSPVAEGFRRQEIDADELAEIRRTDKFASKWKHSPSGRMSFSVQGTEGIVRATWSGTPTQLEPQLRLVVATCLELMAQQPGHRRERELAEEQRRQEAERQALLRRQHEARQEQLKRAFEAAQQYEQELVLRRFLEMIEREADRFQEPFPERAKVWLGVVRAQLDAASPWRKTLGHALLAHSWQSWPPDWWPASETGDQ